MIRLEALEDAFTIATGKALPASGSKRDKITKLAIKLYRDWQTEPGVEWNSLYSVIGAGTVSATDTFDLDTDINYISTSDARDNNFVRVKTADSQYINFRTVKPGQLHGLRDVNAVAKISENRIRFSRTFTADDQAFGGTIEVPAIVKLDDILSDTDEILIDNPNWLPARLAAQYVLNDRQLNYLYDDLLAQANELMRGMIETNDTGDDSINTGIDYFSSLGNVNNVNY
jgi:hypothetical protein